ncbi:hypothetical protein RUM44_006876 [Polyplax serrata]|uniref:Rho-GAP domain-containing protein n=1 Tax=Polyplax serrata TaxID=468196 RepID=A0ABR1AJC5_POLSC
MEDHETSISSSDKRQSIKSSATKMGKTKCEPTPTLLKERKCKKEKWLLTRKTWRYMSDAGRRLIPEGVQNRQEDIPKIEAYFQEVCQKEPKFLLWRKSSYPGALTFRTHSRRIRPRKKVGSYREKASSADETDDIKKSERTHSGSKMLMTPTTAGRFDLLKVSADDNNELVDDLLNQLENYLKPKPETVKKLNHKELIDKLQKYLEDIQAIQKEVTHKYRGEVIPEPPQKERLETIKRYYSKLTNREAVISNFLTDRKLLEKLYFDLRKTRGFRGGYSYLTEYRPGGFTCSSDMKDHTFQKPITLPLQDNENMGFQDLYSSAGTTPTIEVQTESRITKMTQTPIIHPDMLKAIEDKLKKVEDEQVKVQVKEAPKTPRRKSSLDHDDVSPSVGDTIKRYLKMARKKSIDTDKKDKFKTINYDENLRNIKPKGEISTIGNDEGQHKGCQAGETWLKVLKDLTIEDAWIVKDHKEVTTVCVEKYSKISDDALASSAAPHAKTGLLSSGQLFLSNLLHGLQHTDKNTVLPTAMQKSKSSTSVGRNLVSKKIWRGRSKSQSRLSTTQPCSWTPQGNCIWSNLVGKQVTLTDTNILHLSDIERRVLQKVALAKLQALNIGCNIQIPSETTISTGSSGMVFGVSLSQCIENERLNRNTSSNTFKTKSSTFPDDSNLELKRKSHHGSRTSFSSLIEPRPQDESAGSMESLGSSVPGLLDVISVGSTADITLNTADNEPRIPNIVSSCLRHIETHGLHTLGIFRVSSSKKRVRQLRECFDSGKDVCLDEYCPHDVATLLKEYFRDLPEPLLCKDLYQAFVLTQKLRNRKLQFEAMQHLIQLLPTSNRDTLWSLLNFLAQVAANCDDQKSKSGEMVPGNKMDSNNLATLFAPNILHCCSAGTITKESLSAQSCEERIDVINVIRSMIDHNKSLFQVPAELLDEVYLHMMDTNPEAVDQLLRKREMLEEGADDPDSEALEEIGTGSESSSLPQTPKTFTESEAVADKEEKKTYSREQFLHERSAFELFDIDTGPRSRDRERGKGSSTLRRARRESTTKLYTETHTQQDEENNSLHENSGILKASLTIPTSSFTLNLDDSDIPFIEDSNNLSESSKHQMTMSMVRNRTSVSSNSTRNRSTNGSDSSQSYVPLSVQGVTGQYSPNQGPSSYDSAVETSTTFSSPPRHTTASSLCSGSDREYYSSPPSWGSSPPLSPDSHTSTLDELSDDAAGSTIGRISISTKTSGEIPGERYDAEGEIVRISLKGHKFEKGKIKETSKVSEVRKTQGETEKKQETSKSVTKDFYQRVHSLVGGGSQTLTNETLTKSASSSQLVKKAEIESDVDELNKKISTSISNIGGAVMRSKTADIERMLKIKPEVKKSKGKTETKTTTKAETEKKYSRRRYIDSRHPTKQIPDMSDKAVVSQSPKTQSIWKRREIISSPPKGGEDS